MINLIICISSFIIGVFICWVDYNLKTNTNWMIKIPRLIYSHFTFVDNALAIFRFICFFSFGFFMMETIKYFSGQTTLIF